MKILHIIPSYKPAYIYGGTIESVGRLCESLSKYGNEITVFTTTANGKTELDVLPGKEYIVEGVKVFYFKRITKDPAHISPALWRKLYRECKQYDVVHLHSWWNILIIVAAYICKQKKQKIIFSPRGMLSNYIIAHSNSRLKRLFHSVAGKTLLKSTIFHATSQAEFKECEQLIKGWKGFMVFNIIWLPAITREKKRNECFTVLFLSRLHPKKGIELLMEAVSKIQQPVQLQIAGTGEKGYIDSLKKKCKLLGIEKNTEWLGWLNRYEKFSRLMQADLFALTSYNENFANVVVESLHAGTPVLLSTEVGLAGFIAKHELGWIAKINVPDIKKNIESAFHNKERCKTIQLKAPLIEEEYFSEKVLIPQYLHHYKAAFN